MTQADKISEVFKRRAVDAPQAGKSFKRISEEFVLYQDTAVLSVPWQMEKSGAGQASSNIYLKYCFVSVSVTWLMNYVIMLTFGGRVNIEAHVIYKAKATKLIQHHKII